jgi:mono/diheme cytochrome c family protein
MTIRHALVCSTLVLAISGADARGRAIGDKTLPSSYVPSGEVMFKQYCATCHGADAMGNGPLAASLKTPPADLTTLAKRHGGRFPYDYVTNVLRFGPGPSVHGSSDMPAWGPIFRSFNKHDERAVQKRIKNLCDYLASLQRN